jgi:hypothetical protein
MIVYHVSEGRNNAECPRRYVATLKEARAIRNSYNRIEIENGYWHNPMLTTIEKVKLDTSKESILSMLNYHGGFELSAEKVA